MIGPIEHRAGERVESRIDERVFPATLLLDRPHLGDEKARLGREVTARLDLEADAVAKRLLQFPACGIPEREVAGEIGVHFARFVGHRQATAGGDGRERAADLEGHPLERAGHLGQMRQIGAAADVHVQARDAEPGPLGAAEHVGNLLVPDAVLRTLAAGVGLLAVTMAEAGVHTQGDARPRHPLGKLLEHVGRATIDVDAELRHRVEALAVEDVGRVDDRMGRRQAGGIGRAVGMSRVAGGQRPVDFASAHGIDEHARAADQVEHREIGAGLLGEPHGVPGREVAAAAADHLRVVGVERRAILAGEFGHADAGDLVAKAVGVHGGRRCDHWVFLTGVGTSEGAARIPGSGIPVGVVAAARRRDRPAPPVRRSEWPRP